MATVFPSQTPRATNDLAERARTLLATEISFIHAREFATLAINDVEADVPLYIDENVESFRDGEHAVGSALLTPQGERHLFRQMNFFKYRANALRSRLSDKRVRKDRILEIEGLLQRAEQARDKLVQANLRLVLSIAQSFASSREQFEEFVSEGNLILLAAIDKFDYSRGFRFSTYATHSIRRHFVRLLQRQHRRRTRERPASNDVLGRVAAVQPSVVSTNPAVAAALISRFRDRLNPRERMILENRFGLTGDDPATTLKAIADRVGLSKERVRQLQLRAIEKLQDLAAELRLRPDGD